MERRGWLLDNRRDETCVRLKALVIQDGEIPPPVKPNQQPVLSLGVEAARSDLSVDNDNDPQIPCQHHSQAVTVAL